MAEAEIQSYRAGTMREALSLVRADLGDDALIVSQEREGDVICIRACSEAADEPAPAERVPNQFKGRNQENWSVADLRFATEDIDQLRGAFRILGSSGVGKTSLLIRLLARHVSAHGAHDVLVVSTDVERLAANEALLLACQMFEVEFVECPPQRLRDVLAMRLDAGLTLIDTASLTEESTRSMMRLAGVRDISVFSAEHSLMSLDAQLERMDVDVGTACVFTHCERTFDRAALLSWLARRGLALMGFCHSARIPNGLVAAEIETASRFLAPEISGVSVSL